MKRYKVHYELSIYGKVFTRDAELDEEKLRELQAFIEQVQGEGYPARLDVEEVEADA